MNSSRQTKKWEIKKVIVSIYKKFIIFEVVFRFKLLLVSVNRNWHLYLIDFLMVNVYGIYFKKKIIEMYHEVSVTHFFSNWIYSFKCTTIITIRKTLCTKPINYWNFFHFLSKIDSLCLLVNRIYCMVIIKLIYR